MNEEKFDLVIPVGDQNGIPFHLFRSEYESAGTIYLLDENAFQITNSKILTYQFALSLGIHVPRSEIISNTSDLSAVLSKFTLPVMLKPASSFTLENLIEKSYVKRIDTPEQWEKSLQGMLLHGEVLVQEYFEGIGIGIEVLAHEGKILTSFQHVRIHGVGKSGSTYRKSQPVDETFLSAAKKMIKALYYSGVAMFEFRYNPEMKTWVLIEINGRFWGSLPLPLACGVDFPYYLYQMLVEERREFPKTYRTGLYCRNTSADLQWMANSFFQKDSLDNKKRYSMLRYFIEFGNILLLREKNDVFVMDDPLPGIMEFYRLFRKGYSTVTEKFHKKITIVYYSHKGHSTDIHTALKNSHSILFVCYGNICRSPFAEAYLRKIRPLGIQIRSCGYYSVPERSCPVEAVVAAKNYGVDLSGHRSRVISDELIQKSDIIFIFDDINMQEITSRYQGIQDKVWYLSEISSHAPVSIPDPYGQDLTNFEKVYGDIAGNIKGIASIVN
jgi:protein-tyrosine-phosphatase/predicted ATP-grasp superfamily ATP-dependent carboligase